MGWQKRTGLAGILFGLAAAIALGLFFSCSISKPISRIDASLDEISNHFSNATDHISAPITTFSGPASEAAQKLAKGIEQINIALGEISRTAQSNAASAQESEAVAQEINALANSVTGIVSELKANGKFRLTFFIHSYRFYSPSPLTANPLGPNPVDDGVPAILARKVSPSFSMWPLTLSK